MFDFPTIDPANVPNPLAGRTKTFIGLDGVLRTKKPNGDVVTYQTGLSPEDVQDIVGAMLTNTSTVQITYDDETNSFSAIVVQSGISHGSIADLLSDHHTQYFNQSRGDARYYTKTLLDGGQLDNRYYTEPEVTQLVNSRIASTEKGAANGVPTLDGTIKIPLAQIPALPYSPTIHGHTSSAISDFLDAVTAIGNGLYSLIGHVHGLATDLVDGFMSKEDKAKLDGMIADVVKIVTVAITNTSNATFQTVNEMAIPVIAGKRYKFKFDIIFDSAAAGTGIGLSVGGSASGSLRATAESCISNNGGTSNKFVGPLSALNGVILSTAVGASGTQYIAEIEGIFTATSSGLIYPQFRSETNGTQVRVNVDSLTTYREY